MYISYELGKPVRHYFVDSFDYSIEKEESVLKTRIENEMNG